jgi:hypothetical protein
MIATARALHVRVLPSKGRGDEVQERKWAGDARVEVRVSKTRREQEEPR